MCFGQLQTKQLWQFQSARHTDRKCIHVFGAAIEKTALTDPMGIHVIGAAIEKQGSQIQRAYMSLGQLLKNSAHKSTGHTCLSDNYRQKQRSQFRSAALKIPKRYIFVGQPPKKRSQFQSAARIIPKSIHVYWTATQQTALAIPKCSAQTSTLHRFLCTPTTKATSQFTLLYFFKKQQN